MGSSRFLIIGCREFWRGVGRGRRWRGFVERIWRPEGGWEKLSRRGEENDQSGRGEGRAARAVETEYYFFAFGDVK